MPCTAQSSLAAMKHLVIPRIMHQSWVDNRTIPRVLAAQAARWRTVLPDWEYRLWTDEMNRVLWQDHFPELMAVYDNYSHPVMRADAARLLYMHVHGGVYADLDVAPCDAVSSVIGRSSAQLLLVRDPWRGSLKRKQQQHISNFFFASVKGHPFWAYAIRGLANRQNHGRGVMFRTGPYFLNSMYRRFVREHRSCPSGSMPHVNVLTYDEWQAGSHRILTHPTQFHPILSHLITSPPPTTNGQVGPFASHHWSSTWHYNTVIQDEGLLSWLGVNETNDCRESRLEEIFRTRNGSTLFRRVKFNTYPPNPDNVTRRRYVIFVEGENGGAARKEAKRMERVHRYSRTSEVVSPLRKTTPIKRL